MSIILKGIDMPKAGEKHRITIYDNGEAYITTSNRLYETDRKDVEVIEIPTPHGRLIDASELIKSYMKGTKTDIDDFYDTIDIIDNAPTILEAEGRTYTIQADSETVSYKNGENQF